MRRESLLFAGSAIVSTALFGISSVPALFIFGFAWLIWSKD